MMKKQKRKTVTFRFDPNLNDKLGMVAHKLRTTKTRLIELGLEKLFAELQSGNHI